MMVMKLFLFSFEALHFLQLLLTILFLFLRLVNVGGNSNRNRASECNAMSFITFAGVFLLFISDNDGSEIEQKVPKINKRNAPVKVMNDMPLHPEALFQLKLPTALKRDVEREKEL
jgi:hypothetical protein